MGMLRIRTRYYRNIARSLLLLIILTSCGINEAKTPEQWFDFTWSGLAGCDALTFRGLAALQRGSEQVLEESISYTGQLKEHRELKIKAEPDGGNPAGRFHRMQTPGTGKSAGFEAMLRWEDGDWLLQSQESDALLQGMKRLNPLDQLEEIRRIPPAAKKISAESGAARGTKVLRIELDPAEAGIRLKDKLLSEMELLRQDWDKKLANVPPEKRVKLQKELSSIWTAGNEQLQQRLESMEAGVVYHLTIDRKSGLPARLTSETTMEYWSPQGTRQREVLRTDNRFVDYK
ncbi:hypothetical protein [Paenibacillus macerans]|uniref:hypothetical protein n=1 Tax=Paenibacillus macerans TaxID=44252 RepID=UPI003D30F7F1